MVGLIRSIKLKLFAAPLLRAMAQEQARTGSERVSPRHPEVACRLGLEPDSPELGIAERYLVREDYIRPSGADREVTTPTPSRRRVGRIWATSARQRGGAGGLGGRGCSVSRQRRRVAQGSSITSCSVE
jgi:hypothetical protein